MVAVAIIGLMISITLPAVKKVRGMAMKSEYMNDVRVLAAAFEQYSLENGAWPRTRPPGVLPPEMTGYITGGSWDSPAPFGGLWKWNRNNNRDFSIIMLWLSTPLSAEEMALMADIDEKIDDGARNGGHFRYNNRRIRRFLVRNS